ncbi:TPA: primase C-terminal domain-containing protein [Listeria monocytogenes]|nr:primase C-terminal domain-containing protein [Listeria monocytogenes]HDT8704594.1 primase C-terminal domain-containing protein [Listeria monocytogenes]HDT8716573.1 primase C-terminal domain-containing protein [Listeria monocytogenes]HDT9164590.1 primase C-terminal domain-containing protein [Listeria monocytogenes]HDT9627803.1 primase C-terminal domain-containing protein [Listeria monocytogenes]
MLVSDAIYTYSAVINTVVHEGLTAYRKKNSRGVMAVRDHFAAIEAASTNRKGVQFVVRDKSHLQTKCGVKGFIVTSQEALIAEVDQITHWTPNTYRVGTYSDRNRKYIKGHEEKNLQQINTFVIDIDTQKVDVAKMITASMRVLNQTPTFILKTDHGFQMYFVLETPSFVSNANQFKSLKIAKRISQNVKYAFAEELPAVDIGCNDFGFFRAPNTQNVAFLNLESQFDFHEMMEWSKSYSDQKRRSVLSLVPESSTTVFDATKQEWFSIMANLKNVRGRKGQYGRNNVAFTLALACYASGKSKQEATDLLDQFNDTLDAPLRFREIETCIRNAYSGRYQGANAEKISDILQTYWKSEYEIKRYTPFIFDEVGKVKPQFFRKHRKSREERTYSHFSEWEKDLECYIESQLLSGQTFLERSQRSVAEALKMPYATLKKILKQSDRIISRVNGKGRAAQTLFSTVAIVVEQAIRHALTKKAAEKEAYMEFLASFTDAAQHVITLIESTGKLSEAYKPPVSLIGNGDRTVQLSLNLLGNVYRRRNSNDYRRSS